MTGERPGSNQADAPAGGGARTVDADDLSEFEEEFGDIEPGGEDDLVPEPQGPAPRIVAFDIGEVLVDETRVWAVWAQLCGVSQLTFAAVLGAAIAQGGDHREVFPHVAPNIEWEAFVDEHERRYGGFRTEDLYPDARPCLTELRALGFTVVIAGNQPRRRAEQLRALGLPHDGLVTSEELGVDKPDPGFFEGLLRMAGDVEPHDVLYVGDRVDNDVLPATAAGLHTCWLRRGPWGALQALPDDVEADLVLEGLGELALLLRHWRETDAEDDPGH